MSLVCYKKLNSRLYACIEGDYILTSEKRGVWNLYRASDSEGWYIVKTGPKSKFISGRQRGDYIGKAY
jgi:hypothetical protein